MAMQSTDKRAGVVFSDLMESLFESVAKVIEIHQPLIETKYGKVSSLRLPCISYYVLVLSVSKYGTGQEKVTLVYLKYLKTK